MNSKITYYKKFFNGAGTDIPFLNLLYMASIPLSILCIKLKLKPNTITTLSNITALLSFYFIIFENNFWTFFSFWTFALLLDISDGIVARETKQQSAQGSFYDHFTDQVKIITIFLLAGIYYNQSNIWILTFLTSTLFLLYSFLRYMIKYRSNILSIHIKKENDQTFFSSINNIPYRLIKKYLYNNLFLMQGNFMIYLGFIFIEKIVIYMFFILLFIILFNLLKNILYMIKINTELDNNNLKWR